MIGFLIIKPGSKAKDEPSGLSGIITHAHIEQDGRVQYLLQPHGINPKDGQPVKRIWTLEQRLRGVASNHLVKLPMEVLGTKVKDTASGFTGIATAFQIHISGCFHVYVQPKGRIKETGDPIASCDFDIRRLEGPAIKKMSEAERDKDQSKRPSPAGDSGLPTARL